MLEQPAAILTLLTKPMVVHPVSYSVFSDVYRASLVAYAVKNLPAMWDTWVRSLGWEDPLKDGVATHSSILA